MNKKKMIITITAISVSILILAMIAVILLRKNQNISVSDGNAIITMKDNESTFTGSGVRIDENKITISSTGTYEFTGCLSDGHIIIDVPSGSVNIILNNAQIACNNKDAIYSKNSCNVVITIKDNTENSLTSGTSSSDLDTLETNDDGSYKKSQKACIYTNGNLTINGKGKLSLTGNIYNGIQSKEGVSLSEASISITSAHHGIKSGDILSLISGNYTITCDQDGIHSDTNITISDGAYTISAGDDGIHAEGELLISTGNITISKSYEGLEAHIITINNGNINITSSDDGINANGGTDFNFGMNNKGPETETTDVDKNDSLIDTTTTPELTINGGNIYVNSEGDGLDSNGNITINGGNLYVDGPFSGGDSALDYGSENNGIMTLNGGTIIAIGMSNMLKAVDSSSTQYSIMYVFNQTISAGTEVKITDSNNNIIMTYTPIKANDSVIISSSDIKQNEEYNFTYGDTTESITVSDVNTTNYSGGGMGPGGNKNGNGTFPNKGDHPEDTFSDNNNKTDGTFPEKGNRPEGTFPGNKDTSDDTHPAFENETSDK